MNRADLIKKIKNQVALDRRYPNWDEYYNWIARDGELASVVAQQIEAAMNEVVIRYADSKTPEMPWNSLFKDGWRICGMNHYNLKGKPHLFVSITKGNLCITAESEDENSIWSDLKAKAELLTPNNKCQY